MLTILPLSETTIFWIINWYHSTELIHNSVVSSEDGYVCGVTDPALFCNFLEEEYKDYLKSLPLFLNLDEDGKVSEIVELWLP